jgi:hypothetical protein
VTKFRIHNQEENGLGERKARWNRVQVKRSCDRKASRDSTASLPLTSVSTVGHSVDRRRIHAALGAAMVHFWERSRMLKSRLGSCLFRVVLYVSLFVFGSVAGA